MSAESNEPAVSSSGDAALALEPPAPVDAYTEIGALVEATTSHTRLLADALKSIARQFGSPYAAIHVRYASEVLQDDWHTGPTDPQFWKHSLQEFLTESLATTMPRAKLLQAKTGSTKAAFLSAPLVDAAGSAIGALALVVAPVDDHDVATRLAALEGLSRYASLAAQLVGAKRPEVASASASGRALNQAAGHSTMEELAFAITNELRNKLGCEQVALGLVQLERVNLVSISGLDSISKRSPGCASLRGAMEECVDADRPVVYQKQEGWSEESVTTGHRLHKQWHESAKGSAVASIPMRDGDRLVAVLSLRKRADDPFTRDQIDTIRKHVEPFGAALILTNRASRSLAKHCRDAVHGMVETLTTPGRLPAKIGGLLGLLATAWFFFGPITYELTVPCTVMPAHVRHVTAPFDGVLASAAVLEGDRVTQGQVLCTFDHRALDQQKVQLLAELAVLERTEDRARADNSPVEVKLALANQQLEWAKLDIVTHKIEQATLKAPFDGIVVAGDLRKRVGGVLARGDPLFKLARLDRLTLQMHVPESVSADLAVGLTGSFATYARPGRPDEMRILRVLGEAQIRDNKNVYLAEADIATPGDWMRPGMEGVAKITVGTRRVCWVALHKVVDYLRMKLWL